MADLTSSGIYTNIDPCSDDVAQLMNNNLDILAVSNLTGVMQIGDIASPNDGDTWISSTGQICQFSNSLGVVCSDPALGQSLYNAATGTTIQFDGNSWQDVTITRCHIFPSGAMWCERTDLSGIDLIDPSGNIIQSWDY